MKYTTTHNCGKKFLFSVVGFYMYDLGATMPVGMDFPPPFTMLEDKDSAFVVDDQKSGDIKPMTKGKPPRHASGLRHSVSTTRLLAVADLVSLSSSSTMSL